MRFTPSVLALLRSSALLVATLACTAAIAPAQSDREQVPGVTNFGRVTDTFFRGGNVTAAGLEHLHAMGVRTVVDLRGRDGNEAATARRLGMQFHAFPMDGKVRPDGNAGKTAGKADKKKKDHDRKDTGRSRDQKPKAEHAKESGERSADRVPAPGIRAA